MGSKYRELYSGIFLSLCSAGLLSLTLPMVNWWWVVWVALVPFFIALRYARSLFHASIFTIVFGATYCIAVVSPLLNLTTSWWGGGIGESENILLVWLLVLGTALYGALIFLPLTYIERKYRSMHMRDVFFVALVWVVIEYVRSQYVLIGYGWGTIGYTLVEATMLRENAFLVGVYGLSFLIITINIFIVLVYERMRGAGRGTYLATLRALFFNKAEKYWMTFFLFIWLVAIGNGVFGHSFTSAQASDSMPLHVATIVAGTSEIPVSRELYLKYREKLESLFTDHPETDIVLFPENVFPFFVVDEDTQQLHQKQIVPLDRRVEYYNDLMAFTLAHPDTLFAVGLHTISGDELYNTLVFYKNGLIIDVLHKQKLVPFFEYAPLGLPIPLYDAFTHGENHQTPSFSNKKIGMLMCSEISDRSILSGEKLDIILSPSNDSVFAGTAAGRFHDVFARMRAIESGAYLLRANKGSFSSIVDPSGDVRTAGFGDAVLFETIY